MTNQRKLLALLLVAAALVSAACGAAPAASPSPSAAPEASAAASDLYDVVKSRGKLIMGTEAFYQPYEFHAVIDGSEQIVGMDIDIANAIAADLGVELEIRDMEFDALIPAVQMGSVDISLAGLNPDAERRQVVDFSEIYYEANHAVVVRKGEEASFPDIASFSGKTVGAQQGTTMADTLNADFTASTPRELGDNPTLILELRSNKIDGLIVEAPVGESFVKQFSDLALAPFIIEIEEGGTAAAIPKGNPKFVEAVNQTLKRLMDAGEIEAFYVAAQELYDQQPK